MNTGRPSAIDRSITSRIRAIVQDVILIKEELERIREQVENLE